MIFKPISFLIVLSLSPTALSAQLLVPTNYPTIQSAVDAAMDGDEILVAPGRYVGQPGADWVVHTGGKSLTFHATGSAEDTVIDGEGERGGILQYTDDDASLWVEGFTVQDCQVGIECVRGRAWVLNCRVAGNSHLGILAVICESVKISGSHIAGNASGGIFLQDCNALTLKSCTIEGNEGTGIECYETVATISDCVIRDNHTESWGGGLVVRNDCQVVVRDCEISENTSTGHGGGGIYCFRSHLTMLDCTVHANTALGDGAGMYGARESTIHVERCAFEQNEAGSDGGGLHFYDNCDVNLIECRIYKNKAVDSGGGLRAYICELTVSGGSVEGNESVLGGGFLTVSTETLVSECRFEQNHAFLRGGAWYVGRGPEVVTAQDCIFDRNWAWDLDDASAMCYGGSLFCATDSLASLSKCTFTESWSMYDGGAMFVYGSSTSLQECTFYNCYASNKGGTVWAGNSGELTMDNCEVWSGNADGSGGGLFLSYPDAQSAHVSTSSFCGNEVSGELDPSDIEGLWLDGGGNTFREDCVLTVDDDGLDSPDADYASIQAAVDALPRFWSVHVYPGRYTGDGQSVVDIRNRDLLIEAVEGPEETVIDGEHERGGIMCVGTPGRPSWEEDWVGVYGFTITNGWASSGGGVANNNCRLYLKECILADNTAKWNGGGVWSDSTAKLSMYRCTIDQNRTVNWAGGGIFCRHGELDLHRCVVTNNVSHSWAGGVQACAAEVDIFRCEFKGNQGVRGGAIGIDFGSAEIKECVIEDNVATYLAGAVYGTNASPLIKDCRIARNEGLFYGGLYCEADEEFQVQSSEFCGNLPNNIDGSWTDLGDNRLSEACCDADVNGDAVVDATDLYDLMQAWGPCDGCGADVVQSASVDIEDLLFLLANWGSACQG